MRRPPYFSAPALALTAAVSCASLALAGCGDCREEEKLGDFEMLQRNYKEALKHYDRARRIDPECPDLPYKVEQAHKRGLP